MTRRQHALYSGTWAALACVAGWFAGIHEATYVAAVLGVASLHTVFANGLERTLATIAPNFGPGRAAVAALLAWVTLSLLVMMAAFASSVVVTALASVVMWRMHRRQTTPSQRNDLDSRTERIDYVLVLVASAIALYFAHQGLFAASVGYANYQGNIWIDAPFHASYVSALASGLANDTYTDVHGANLPTQFYHLGVYAIPALIKAISHCDALALAQVFTALGVYWLAIALYAVTAGLSENKRVATVSALCVLVLPDLGQTFLGHPAFGFHWLLQVAAASSTGLAMVLCAVAILNHACREQQWRLILIAWAFTLATALFKAQLFVAIAVPIFLLPAFWFTKIRWRVRAAFLVLQLAAVALVTYVASSSPNLPLVRFDFSVSSQWFAAVAPSAPDWARQYLAQASTVRPILSTIAFAATFFLWTTALWGMLWLVAQAILRRETSRQPTLIIWAVSAAYFITVVGLAPDNRNATGGPLEVHLQTQIVGYACFAMLAALAIVGRVDGRWGATATWSCVAVSALFFVFVSPWHASLQRNDAIPTATYEFAPDQADVALLRQKLSACDLLLIADGDPYMIWQAALERPLWVTDYAFNPKHRPEVAARLAEWRAVRGDPERWLAARGVTLLVQPANAQSAAPATPVRAPDIEGKAFRAWRLATIQKCPSTSTSL